MLVKLVVTLSLTALTVKSENMVVLKSTASLQDSNVLSGLHLIPGRNGLRSILDGTGFAFCTRFNFRRLAFNRSILASFASLDWHLLLVEVGYRFSCLSFGNNDWTGSAPSWLIGQKSDPTKEVHYSIWSANRWTSICMAYNASIGYVSIVKVKNTFQGLLSHYIHSFKKQSSNLSGVFR